MTVKLIRHRHAAAIAIAAAVAMTPAPASEAKSKPVTCSPTGSKTVEASRQLRVFTWHSSFWGCALRKNRAKRLESTYKHDVRYVRLAGDYVAFVRYVIENADSIDVINLFTQRTLEQLRPVQPTAPAACNPPSGWDVFGLALKRNGSVAWLSRWDACDVSEVHRADSTGESLVDSSAAIDPQSLALATPTSGGSNFIYWLKGGVAEWAPIR